MLYNKILMTSCPFPDPNEHFSCWRYLYLWGDDKCPDLDLKRFLLAYLYIIGWKGGSLFPSKDELKNPPANGIFTTFMEEDDMYATLNDLYRSVLKRDDKLGSHTGRKSGYLLGVMRGAPAISLMVAADHDSYAVATRYVRDAEAIMEVNNCFNDPKQQVGDWKNPHCAGDETAARSAAPGARFQRPLPELVMGFIELHVGILPTDPRRHYPKYVMEKVLAWRKPGADPASTLNVSTRSID